MIIIFLILLLVMQLLKFWFKVDKSYLYCGIFAFSGVKNIEADRLRLALNKIKILGMYNESRGGQGAGLFVNNKIIKCGDKYKTFPALIANNIIQETVDNHILIGHCRKMSRGTVSYENSHPFMINDNLVGVHNGTIENIWSLTSSRKIDTQQIFSDSKALYMIIEQEGTEVLNEYKGGAALIWTKMDKPNSLWVYHGKSKKYAAGQEEEERPLYFMKTEEGMYFSSMEDSLWAIRDEEDQMPEELPFNVVLGVTNGRFTNVRKPVDRGTANVSTYVPATNYNTGVNFHGGQNAHIGSSTSVRKANFEPTVWRETVPPRLEGFAEGTYIYSHKGRYYTGPGQLCEGEVFLLKRGIIAIPGTLNIATPYYFYKGALLKNKKAYEDLQRDVKSGVFPITNTTANFAMYLSRYTEYPVTNLPSESAQLEPEHRFKWYLDFKPAKEGFTAKYTARNYKISKLGYLEDISSSVKNDKTTLYPDFKSMHAAQKAIGEDVDQAEITFPGNFQKLIGNTSSTSQNTTGSRNEDERYDKFRDPILDIIFNDAERIYRTIPTVYLIGIRAFTKELLLAELTLDPDENEIDAEMDKYLRTAVQKKISIRQAYADIDGVLDRYITSFRPYDRVDYDGDSAAIADSYNTEMSTPNLQHESDENIDDIDSVLRKIDEQEEADEEEENKNAEFDRANDQVEEILEDFQKLQEKAVELMANESDFAQRTSEILVRSLDSTLHNLATVAEEHSTSSLVSKINNIIA